jgi:hypothetical protein
MSICSDSDLRKLGTPFTDGELYDIELKARDGGAFDSITVLKLVRELASDRMELEFNAYDAAYAEDQE